MAKVMIAVITAIIVISPGPVTAEEQTVTFDNVTLVANPNGWRITGLDNTIDGGITGTIYARIFTSQADATGVVIDYTFDEPKDQVLQLQLWNNGGSFLTDRDGIDSATVEVFDPDDNTLFAGTLNAGNGGAVFVTLFPAALDNVARVRLSNITNLTGHVAPDIIWRELNVLQEVPPQISITKTADPEGELTPGGSVVYTLTVANTGEVDAFNLLIEDGLPDGIDSASWTCAESGGAVCPNASGDLPLSEAIAALPAGSSLIYTITGTVSDAPPAVVINTASVSDTEIVCAEDGSPQPCFASVSNPPVPIVSIAKSTSTALVVTGGTAMFEVVARNTGVVDANGSTVTDVIPTGLTDFDSWTCEAEGGAVCPTDSGSGALNETIATFPAGSLLRWTITASAAGSSPGTIVNTAGIDPPEGGLCSDGEPGPCEAEASIVVMPSAPASEPTPTRTPDPFDGATATPTRTPTPTPTATATLSPTSTPDPEAATAGITPPSTGDGGLMVQEPMEWALLGVLFVFGGVTVLPRRLSQRE